MPLRPGATTFFGQIVLSIYGDQLRKLTKRLRRQLQARQISDAEETLEEMYHIAQRGTDAIGLRKVMSDLYEREWQKAGLPST
jgi:hypothetical protein